MISLHIKWKLSMFLRLADQNQALPPRKCPRATGVLQPQKQPLLNHHTASLLLSMSEQSCRSEAFPRTTGRWHAGWSFLPEGASLLGSGSPGKGAHLPLLPSPAAATGEENQGFDLRAPHCHPEKAMGAPWQGSLNGGVLQKRSVAGAHYHRGRAVGT